MSKWLPDVAPTDRAVEIAARSIAIRLDHVRRYLKRSVKKPDQPENIHQLRVWSRRSEAALSLYDDILPPRRSRRIARMLKRIRRAAGRIRDVDVYAEKMWNAHGRPMVSLRSERIRAQRKLVILFEEFDCGRKLEKRSRRLIERLRERNRNSRQTFLQRAQSTLRPIMMRFFDAAPADRGDDRQLHQFRIAGKELRYAVELLAGAFPPEFREDSYPTLTGLQEKLGTINDLSLTVKRIQEQVESSGNASRLSELARQQGETSEHLEKARREFQSWWTDELARSLHDRLEKFLGPDVANRG